MGEDIGDILGLISDGIYEYENEAGEPFGQERVAGIVIGHGERSAQELVDEIERLKPLLTNLAKS